MATNKTQPTKVTVTQFLSQVADAARRQDCETLVEYMKQATKADPIMWGTSIVGFGKYKYEYASGREGEWPVIGFSPRKNDLTLYLMPGFEQAGPIMKRLGKFKTGKSCLYLKKLSDVDARALKELIDVSVKAMASKRVDQ